MIASKLCNVDSILTHREIRGVLPEYIMINVPPLDSGLQLLFISLFDTTRQKNTINNVLAVMTPFLLSSYGKRIGICDQSRNFWGA